MPKFSPEQRATMLEMAASPAAYDRCCIKCEKWKSLTAFHSTPSRYDKHFTICGECRNKQLRAWRKSNPEKTRQFSRESSLRSMYGISSDEYDRLLNGQGGACKICGRNNPGAKGKDHFAVDHDPHDGRVRGILCLPCNAALGGFAHDTERLKKAVEYLGCP